jgi:hypothetical protein
MNVFQLSKLTLIKFLLVGCITLAGGLATVHADGPNNRPRDLHIVSVGQTYTTNGRGLVPLPCCAKDARDMAAWAQSQKGKLFGDVAVNRMINAEGTRASILKGLRDLQQTVKAGDYTIIYMSGHGGRSGQNGYVFCAYDTNLSWSDIRATLRGVPGTVIVILDACQSGAVTDNGNLIVMSAALASENSIGYRDPNRNSLYTRFLLQGLKGQADMNHDGVISLAEVDAYVSGQLALTSSNPSSTLLRPANVPSALPLAKLAGGNANVAVVAPVIPVAVAGPQLAGTTWSGKEKVQGYGSVTFRFGANGKATMIDSRETVHGSYTVNGNRVTITLPNVAVYEGTINGNTFSGQGHCDTLGSWDFTTSKQ